MNIRISLMSLFILFFLNIGLYSKTALDLFESGCNSTDNKEKEEYFTEALKINPKFILAFRNRAIARKEMKNYEGALKDLNSVIELKSNDYIAYTLRADILILLKKDEDALIDLKKALNLNPKNQTIEEKIQEIELNSTKGYKPLDNVQHKSHEISIKQKNLNLENNFNNQSYINMAITAKKEGKNDIALKYLNSAIKDNPKSDIAYAERGDLKLMLKEYNDSIADFNTAIELNPNNSIYYTKRGKAYEFSGNSQNALNDYKKSITLDSKIPEAWYNLGWMRYKLNDFQGAIDSFNKTIELNPNFASAYNARGWTKEDMGDIEGSKEDFNMYKKISGL